MGLGTLRDWIDAACPARGSAATEGRASSMRKLITTPGQATLSFVDASDQVLAEIHFPNSIFDTGPETDHLTTQAFPNPIRLTLEIQLPIRLHPTHLHPRSVLDLWQRLWVPPLTGLITLRWYPHRQRFVWTHLIVLRSKIVESTLRCLMIRDLLPLQQLRLQRPVKPLVFPLRLRMVRRPMGYSDPQSHQPHGQRRITIFSIRSPRRSVIHQHFPRHSVTPEQVHQLAMNRFTAFIHACTQSHCE